MRDRPARGKNAACTKQARDESNKKKSKDRE